MKARKVLLTAQIDFGKEVELNKEELKQTVWDGLYIGLEKLNDEDNDVFVNISCVKTEKVK